MTIGLVFVFYCCSRPIRVNVGHKNYGFLPKRIGIDGWWLNACCLNTFRSVLCLLCFVPLLRKFLISWVWIFWILNVYVVGGRCWFRTITLFSFSPRSYELAQSWLNEVCTDRYALNEVYIFDISSVSLCRKAEGSVLVINMLDFRGSRRCQTFFERGNTNYYH